MKILMISLLLASNLANAGNCMDTASTQSAIDECSRAEFLAADSAAVEEARALFKRRLGSDKAWFDRVMKAEKAWQAWRDAAAAVHQSGDGSAWRMCQTSKKTRITQEHAAFLRDLSRDGDICD